MVKFGGENGEITLWLYFYFLVEKRKERADRERNQKKKNNQEEEARKSYLRFPFANLPVPYSKDTERTTQPNIQIWRG